MNGKKITNLSKQEIMIMRNLYTIPIGSIQSLGYRIIIDSLRRKKISITTKTGTVKTTTTETETPTPGFGMSLYYSGEISTYDMHRAAKRKEQAQEQTGAPDTVPPETEA